MKGWTKEKIKMENNVRKLNVCANESFDRTVIKGQVQIRK